MSESLLPYEYYMYFSEDRHRRDPSMTHWVELKNDAQLVRANVISKKRATSRSGFTALGVGVEFGCLEQDSRTAMLKRVRYLEHMAEEEPNGDIPF